MIDSRLQVRSVTDWKRRAIVAKRGPKKGHIARREEAALRRGQAQIFGLANSKSRKEGVLNADCPQDQGPRSIRALEACVSESSALPLNPAVSVRREPTT